MPAHRGRSEVGAGERPATIVVSARQVGRRLGWAEDVRALLAGRGVREAEPEALALERAVAALERRLAADGIGEVGDLGVAVSHDGEGEARGVTVTISALGRRRCPRA